MTNNNTPNINTRSTSVTNGYAKIPSSLRVTFWNDCVKLEFFPELPENRRTETRRYDYDNGWITCVTRMKCNELYQQYEDLLLPAINSKKQKSISIPISVVNLLTIDTGVDLYGDGEVHPFIELAKNVDPETLKAESSIMYEFSTGEFIEDYNKETGSFARRVITHNELDTFMRDLNAFREASSKSYVHAARCVDRAYKDSITNGLQKIGERVGADLSFGNSYSRDGMGHGSIFDRSHGGTGEDAPRQQYDTLEDLNDLDLS